jgi:hypothetical protein
MLIDYDFRTRLDFVGYCKWGLEVINTSIGGAEVKRRDIASAPPEDQDTSTWGCSLRNQVRRSSAVSGMGVIALE